MPFVCTGEPLILVEGKRDEAVLRALASRRGLLPFQVYAYEGKDKLLDRLAALVRGESFKAAVSTLGVTRDADANPEGAWLQLLAAIRAAGLPEPARPLESITSSGLKVTAMVMPGPEQVGSLEDLCVRAFGDEPVIECMNRYFECLRAADLPHEENGKSRLHVLLAAEPTFRGALQYHAAEHFVPVQAAVFDQVVDFIRTVTAGERRGDPANSL